MNNDNVPVELRHFVPASFYSYQSCAVAWVVDCFGEKSASDPKERSDRFLEEALELVQALDYTASEAHQMVDYVFNRDRGEPAQEVGGVVHTLSALCSAHNLDMIVCAENELMRVIPLKEKIRAKCLAKPRFQNLWPTASAN